MSDAPSFGTWLRQRRRSRDLTQVELAKLVGCAVGTLRNIETDSARPSKQLAARLARALGVADVDVADAVAFARGGPQRAGWPPAADEPPAPGAARPQRNNLPAQLTGLIGRAHEVDAVCALLLRPDVRLVTLTGTGGTGKTRVALAGAVRLLGAFPDGVAFVDLSAISDPELVIATIAQTLGLVDSEGQPRSAQLAGALRDCALLLLLDNFEQVVAAAPAVTELLAACPQLKVLATSRIALGVVGEYEWPVPPLALPERGPLPPFEQLTQYESVRLFSERARAANPHFAVTTNNAPAVAEICHQLDGLPLAIELAAARAKLFEPQALLARLDRRLTFLTGGRRDQPTRQQTIRNTIDWSYQLLSPAEQALFKRLGVFVGGGTLAAITAVCGGPADDVVEGVAALVGHSLLRPQLACTGDDAEPRFGMLETIRQYALEKLAASGDAATTRALHAAHFAQLAEQAQAQLAGPHQAAWLRRLETEYDNLRATLEWSLGGGDAALGLRLAGTLADFWKARGCLVEGRHWLDAFLAAVPTTSEARIRALHGAIMMSIEQGDLAGAAERVEQHAAAAAELGTPAWAAESLVEQAQLALAYADMGQATQLFERALALFRDQGATLRVANMLLNLGMIKGMGMGCAAQAAPLLDESLALYQQHGYPLGIVMVLLLQANEAVGAADFGHATELGRTALRLAWSSDFPIMLAFSLTILAAPAVMQQRPERAVWLFSAAEEIFETLGRRLSPHEQAQHDRWLAVARATLDEEQFASAWAAGRGLSREQLVDMALDEG